MSRQLMVEEAFRRSSTRAQQISVCLSGSSRAMLFVNSRGSSTGNDKGRNVNGGVLIYVIRRAMHVVRHRPCTYNSVVGGDPQCVTTSSLVNESSSHVVWFVPAIRHPLGVHKFVSLASVLLRA